MIKDSLGNRMKANYEGRAKTFLTRRTPVIMRLDGKAFHTFTRGCAKPYDHDLAQCMDDTALHLLNTIQGAKMAYVQSDEISILITDYDKLETDAWFDYNVQKMCSISAASASTFFTIAFWEAARRLSRDLSGLPDFKPALFDSRVFNIPKEEVVNYFRWRYMDWLRNSIQMLAQSMFSHKQLHGKNKGELHEMCFQQGVNWNDIDERFKNGCFHFRMSDGKIVTDYEMNAMNAEFNNVVILHFLGCSE